MLRSLAYFVGLAAFAFAGNNTITDEVYFDVKIESASDKWTGRFVIGVFGDVLPITAFNFIALAKGFEHDDEAVFQQLWTYKNSLIHRVVPDFLIQMGDVTYKDGRGGRSIYAPYFIDEAFVHSHRSSGMVAMANNGQDTNASQFYVMLTKARWLDKKNVVFGKVVEGLSVLRRISELRADLSGRPKDRVTIVGCGVKATQSSYDLSEEDLDKDSDVRPGPIGPSEVEL